MRKLALFLALCLALGLSAGAELSLDWQEGEAFFPEGEGWRYRYSYRYPKAAGDSFAAQAVNDYFEAQLYEQLHLVIPMFAHDDTMTADGRQEISDSYEVTRNDGLLFSILLSHRQTMSGAPPYSLHSAVFAASGEYLGETLTLRGVCGVGESSTQLAGLVMQDVWRQISGRIEAGEEGWKQGLSEEQLQAGFYPESQFYAEPGDIVVFYLQPGEFREDGQPEFFRYSYQDLEALLP